VAQWSPDDSLLPILGFRQAQAFPLSDLAKGQSRHRQQRERF
jgi:hypothetical protein